MPATPEEHAGTDAAPNGTSATAPAAANEAAAIDEDALERKVSQFNSVHSGNTSPAMPKTTSMQNQQQQGGDGS